MFPPAYTTTRSFAHGRSRWRGTMMEVVVAAAAVEVVVVVVVVVEEEEEEAWCGRLGWEWQGCSHLRNGRGTRLRAMGRRCSARSSTSPSPFPLPCQIPPSPSHRLICAKARLCCRLMRAHV